MEKVGGRRVSGHKPPAISSLLQTKWVHFIKEPYEILVSDLLLVEREREEECVIDEKCWQLLDTLFCSCHSRFWFCCQLKCSARYQLLQLTEFRIETTEAIWQVTIDECQTENFSFFQSLLNWNARFLTGNLDACHNGFRFSDKNVASFAWKSIIMLYWIEFWIKCMELIELNRWTTSVAPQWFMLF